MQHSSAALLKQERETRLRVGELLEHRPCFFFSPTDNMLGGERSRCQRTWWSRRQLFNFFPLSSNGLLLLLVATSFFTRSLSSSTQAKCPFVGTPDLPLMCPEKRHFLRKTKALYSQVNEYKHQIKEVSQTYREVLIYYPVHQLK